MAPHRRFPLALCAVVLVVWGVGSSPPADAAPSLAQPAAPGPSFSTTLPFHAFQMVVDDANRHVLVVGAGGSKPGVAVMGFDGSLVRVIRLPGATNETLDATAHTLYVSQPRAGQITALDAATLQVTAAFAVPNPAACPTDLAVSSGLVWFSYDCNEPTDVGIGMLDPTDGSTQLFPHVAGPFHVTLLARPSLPDVLFAGQDEDSPPDVWKFDTTGGSLTQLAFRDTHDFGGGTTAGDFRGVSMTPDGPGHPVAQRPAHLWGQDDRSLAGHPGVPRLRRCGTDRRRRGCRDGS